MPQVPSRRREIDKAADIVRDAGGKIVGRTRFQKIAYLLEAAGLGEGFNFGYRHYGPYSEELTIATHKAALLGLLEEEEIPTSWGGSYSIYTAAGASRAAASGARVSLVREAVNADPVELELAATAVFLALEGSDRPWVETAKRKPDKANSVPGAKLLYRKLASMRTPKRLPEFD